MIQSFLEYIFESKDMSSIKLYYSKQFREILLAIESTSKDTEVRRLASSIRHSENSTSMSSDITLIDLTDKNDMVSFIQYNRIKRKWDDKSKDSMFSTIWKDDIEDWIQNISQSETDSLWKEQRGEVKIGKFTKKLHKDNGLTIADSIVEKFVNDFKATYDFDKNLEQKMELVSGEGIKKWYLSDNYVSKSGQLGNSCMRYEKCQKYFDIYVKNPEVCSLLVMYSDSTKTKISGRALVWKDTNGDIVLDRVYTSKDSDVMVFLKYAESKGWAQVSYKTRTIQLKKDLIYDFYPYIDNFYIFNHEKFYLTNNESNWPSEGYWKLQNTDGTYTSDEGIWSEYHGEYIERDSAIWCEGVGDYVHSDEAIYLEYRDMYASPVESTVYSNWSDQTYYLDDTVHSEVMNDYLLTDEVKVIFINYHGDEDYIPKDFPKEALVTVEYEDGSKVQTLDRFVIKDPLTGKLHFRDEQIDGVKIDRVILNNLSNVDVDIDKIKSYLINTDFVIDDKKIMYIRSLYNVYAKFSIMNNDITRAVIKYLLFAYPNNENQRNGLPRLSGIGSKSEQYLRFKNMILNFDTELLKILTNDKSEVLEGGSYDSVFALTKISYSFVSEVFQDPEIYKMWYKWKMSS